MMNIFSLSSISESGKVELSIRGIKLSPFWILHISVWVLVWWSYTFLHFSIYGVRLKTAIWDLLVASEGFLVTLILWNIYRRIDIKSYSIIKIIIIVILCTFVGANLWNVVDFFILNEIMRDPVLPTLPVQFRYYVWEVFYWSIFLFSWSAFYFVIKMWLEWKKQKEQTQKEDILAQQAQLQMLRYQINPHFLFNSLNSIRALIEEDAENAKLMINELSEFLNYSLTTKASTFIPLSTEIEAASLYFAIEKKRFEDKLKIVFDIGKEAQKFRVVSFLLHPLIENAIKYGMQTSALPLKIEVKASVHASKLVLSVFNTGRWIGSKDRAEFNKLSTGTGLENVRQRLENAFPGSHSFNVAEVGEGVMAEIRITANKQNGIM
ncbi:sensor histidine kinase [Candidatus Neomarinimicrobiota bacterium]